MTEDLNQAVVLKLLKKQSLISTVNLLAIIVLSAIIVLPLISAYKSDTKIYPSFAHSVSNSDCNVQIVSLHGILNTTSARSEEDQNESVVSTEVMTKIMDAQKNPQIKGIMLDVDSPGGSVVSGSEIADFLSSINKPVVAWTRTMATSAGYWAILGADKIIANENSNIGGIGVTYSFLDQSEKDRKDGLIYQQLSVGKFKDTGNPSKPLTDEEKELLLKEAEKIYESFVSAVAHYRNLDGKKVRELADGSTFLGQQALQYGLVDEIGGLQEVQRYMEQKINSKVNFCWR